MRLFKHPLRRLLGLARAGLLQPLRCSSMLIRHLVHFVRAHTCTGAGLGGMRLVGAELLRVMVGQMALNLLVKVGRLTTEGLAVPLDLAHLVVRTSPARVLPFHRQQPGRSWQRSRG